MKIEPKYRRPLIAEQIEILELLYKFRFITVESLKDYFYHSKPGMNAFRRLETLEGQGFIAKRYFDNYRLLHKPVAYYLTPAGVRKLNQYRDVDDQASVKAVYRDSSVSEQHVLHCVSMLGLYNRLTIQHGDKLDFLTRVDQADIESLPKQKPDAYIEYDTGIAREHYFVDILDDESHLLISASTRLRHYIKYQESGDWTLVSDAPFPAIVFMCAEEFGGKVQKRCEAILNKSWAADINLTVTTNTAFVLGP